MTPADRLLRSSVSHAVGLGRYSSAVAARVVSLLDSDDEAVAEALGPLAGGAGRVSSVLARIRVVNAASTRLVGGEVGRELEELADAEVDYQSGAVEAAVPDLSGLASPTAAVLKSIVYSQPFQGGLLREWVAGLEDGRLRRIRQAVRIGVASGESVDQITRRIMGTAGAAYRDGILAISRRSAVAMVRTAVAHVSSAAREAYLSANPDVFSGVQWISVLDTGTTPACASLHGRVFALGRGPRPPHHIGCRSTTTPVLRGYAAPEVITYEAWFRGLSVADQDEILGVTRGRLYRSGRMALGRFTDRSGRLYTIAELRRRDAAALASLAPSPK